MFIVQMCQGLESAKSGAVLFRQRVKWTVQSQFNISLGKKMISTKVFCLSMLIFIEFVTTERLVRTSVDFLDKLPSIVFAQ